MLSGNRPQVSDLPDLELVTLAQAGSEPAVAELWVRHYGATLRTASRVARQPRDAEEIASDAFTAMIQACRNGHGPTTSVRAYLATSVRNLAGSISTGPRAAEILSDDIATFDHAATTDPDQVAHLAELSIIREAFTALPQRWQIVLWRTAVDHENHQNVADAMGLTRNGVAALALRARKALKTAYLQAHVSRGTVEPACQPFLPLLADATQHPTITDPDLTDHLADCHRCRDRLAELRLIDQNLAGIVLPAALALTTTITTTTATAAATTAAGTPGTRTARHRPRRRHWLAAAVLLLLLSGGSALAAGLLADRTTPRPSAAPSASPATPSPVAAQPLAPTVDATVATAPSPSTTPAATSATPSAAPPAPPPPPAPSTTTTRPTTTSSFAPAVVDITLGGVTGGASARVDVTVTQPVAGMQLVLTVPVGVTLTGTSGQWTGCTQNATTISCAGASATGLSWSGTVLTAWDTQATGVVQAQVTLTTTGGPHMSDSVSAPWPIG